MLSSKECFGTLEQNALLFILENELEDAYSNHDNLDRIEKYYASKECHVNKANIKKFNLEYNSFLEKQESNKKGEIHPSLEEKKKQIINQYLKLKKEIKEILNILCAENVYVVVANKTKKVSKENSIICLEYAIPGSIVSLQSNANGIQTWNNNEYFVWDNSDDDISCFYGYNLFDNPIVNVLVSGYNYISKQFTVEVDEYEEVESKSLKLKDNSKYDTKDDTKEEYFGGIKGNIKHYINPKFINYIETACLKVKEDYEYDFFGNFSFIQHWFGISYPKELVTSVDVKQIEQNNYYLPVNPFKPMYSILSDKVLQVAENLKNIKYPNLSFRSIKSMQRNTNTYFQNLFNIIKDKYEYITDYITSKGVSGITGNIQNRILSYFDYVSEKTQYLILKDKS